MRTARKEKIAAEEAEEAAAEAKDPAQARGAGGRYVTHDLGKGVGSLDPRGGRSGGG